MSGDVIETTLDQDKAVMPILSYLDRIGQLGSLQLDYGQDTDKFAACKGYYIDVVAGTVIFLTDTVAATAENTAATTID